MAQGSSNKTKTETPSAEARSGGAGERAGQFRAHLSRIRTLQQSFRGQPIGGRLLPLKKVLYWFSASAFDRQGKVIEGLLDLLQAMEAEIVELRGGHQAAFSTSMGETALGKGTAPTAQGENELPIRIRSALEAPAEMLLPERTLLYSLLFATKPRFALEIGTLRGGSSAIICAAMDDSGHGQLVCVEPRPRIEDAVWRQIRHRAILIQGASPEALSRARQAVPEDFQFVLIDGDHSYEGVLKDIEGSLAVTAPGAYLLFHDSHFFEIEEAIDEALRRHPSRLCDCGVLSVERNPEGTLHRGRPVVWGGLRLLRRQG